MLNQQIILRSRMSNTALEIQNEKALLENKWIANTLLLSCILCCQFQDLFQSDLSYVESSMTAIKIHVTKFASKLSKRPKKRKKRKVTTK